jgi:hypothetical protein
MTVLKDAIYQLTPQLDLKKMEFLKHRIEELYKSYEEPEFDKDGKFISKRIKMAHQMVDASKLTQNDLDMMEDQDLIDDLKKEMELPEGTLVTNLFIPAMIACTKIDLIQQGDQEVKEALSRNQSQPSSKGADGQILQDRTGSSLDYIQQELRRFCLRYGAALVFGSCH